MVLWIKLRTSCLHKEHFTSWATSPAWDCVFLLLLEPYIFYHIVNTPRCISVSAGSSGLLPSGLLPKYLIQGYPWVSPNTFFPLPSHVGFHTSWPSFSPLCLLPSLGGLCLPITALNTMLGTIKMIQWVKVPSINLMTQVQSPETHMVEGENQLL